MFFKKKEKKEEEKKTYTCGDWKQGDKVQRIGMKNLGIVTGFNRYRMESVCVEWIKQDVHYKDKVCLVENFMYPFTLKKADMNDIKSSDNIGDDEWGRKRGVFDEDIIEVIEEFPVEFENLTSEENECLQKAYDIIEKIRKLDGE